MRNFEDDPGLADLLDPAQIDRLASNLARLGLGQVHLSAERQEGAVPVEFNLETVGWLSADCDPDTLNATAELVAFILFFVAKYRLAANIHHDATEAGYAELQRKHDALQESEARYRTLSGQLTGQGTGRHHPEGAAGTLRKRQDPLRRPAGGGHCP